MAWLSLSEALPLGRRNITVKSVAVFGYRQIDATGLLSNDQIFNRCRDMVIGKTMSSRRRPRGADSLRPTPDAVSQGQQRPLEKCRETFSASVQLGVGVLAGVMAISPDRTREGTRPGRPRITLRA